MPMAKGQKYEWTNHSFARARFSDLKCEREKENLIFLKFYGIIFIEKNSKKLKFSVDKSQKVCYNSLVNKKGVDHYGNERKGFA
jgi:hypothetical protein